MEKTVSTYESILVISMKLGEEGSESLIKKFEDLIKANATLNNVDKWGKRKLAYMINKESEAFYVLFQFSSNSSFPKELDRVYTITDGVLRSLIVKKES